MVNFKKQKKRGFTLVEILIVVTMIAIISAIVWLNHNRLDRQLGFERSVSAVAQEIRGALEMTLAASFDENEGTEFKGGYGVFFPEEESYYIVFADRENTKTYNEPLDKIKRVDFEGPKHLEKTKITNVSFNEGCNPPPTHYSVLFLSPDPEIFIGGENKCSHMEITIEHEDLLEKVGKVIVNRGGLIESLIEQ